MSEYILAIENRLNTFFSHGVSGTEKLKDAVLYSLLAGGKRIRPVLVLEFSRALDLIGKMQLILPVQLN